jgi:hypothetical protein
VAALGQHPYLQRQLLSLNRTGIWLPLDTASRIPLQIRASQLTRNSRVSTRNFKIPKEIPCPWWITSSLKMALAVAFKILWTTLWNFLSRISSSSSIIRIRIRIKPITFSRSFWSFKLDSSCQHLHLRLLLPGRPLLARVLWMQLKSWQQFSSYQVHLNNNRTWILLWETSSSSRCLSKTIC